MQSRLNYGQIDPEARKTLLGLESYQDQTRLEQSLVDLVKIRASQINRCAFCLDMHAKDALASGETMQRINMLSAWRDSPFYSERERAALAWTESVTRLAEEQAADDLYEVVRHCFDEREIISLTMAVVAINAWNRVNVAFRTETGTYQSQRKTRVPAVNR